MSDPAAGDSSLIALGFMLPDGPRPRGSKLDVTTWRRAATLYAINAGKIRLRTLCSELGISHKTAWRMRERFHDAAAVFREQGVHRGDLPAISSEGVRNAD